MSLIHVIGAGLAGLSAAVRLTQAGHKVRLYEAADQAGGRCRSYYDKKMDLVIDNGNHLLFSANRSALDYLEIIGARQSLIGPDRARFSFVDLENGERWSVQPGSGALPSWLLDSKRRVAGTRWRDYLFILSLMGAGRDDTIADRLKPEGALWKRFWEPLAVSVLNTPAAEASAWLLWKVMRESFLRGEPACRPLIARDSLAASLVDPAIDWLNARGGEVMLNRRVKALTFQGPRVRALWLAEGEVMIEEGDGLVVALPPWAAAELLPGLDYPDAHHAILNAHFVLPDDISQEGLVPEDEPFLGVIGGLVQWIFLRGKIASVTVSAADDWIGQPNQTLAARLWQDVTKALALGDRPLPERHRVIKEKRATFRQDPLGLRLRPGPRTQWQNLALAGDWTDTGYPATIESAIRSGAAAAGALPALPVN